MRRTLFLTGLIAAPVAAAAAQSPALPPIRQLGPATATSAESFGLISGLRHLPDGRVLVNEPAKRRVLLLDSTLTQATVVADSTGATANAYSGRTGGLIAWKGDSTLFVDPAAMSMLVIDGAGKIGRVMSVPRSQDAAMIAGGFTGGAHWDGNGHLVYRGPFAFARPMRGANGAFTMPEMPDSAPLVRVNVATRVLDTVTFLRVPKTRMNVTQDSAGRVTMQSTVNPLPLVDEWSVLADGSIAVVRGRDYHVDFFRPDGTRESAAKVPFEWQRLSDDDKAAFIDSVKVARERMQASGDGGMRQVVMGPGGGGPPGAGGGEGRVMVFGGPGGGSPAAGRGGPGGAGGPGGGEFRAPQVQFVAPSELPDYKPPFLANAIRADAEGRLWIRTVPTKAIPGGPVYDVVDAKGALVTRVQVPVNRTIVGFGAGGVVYLLAREGTTTRLERARLQ